MTSIVVRAVRSFPMVTLAAALAITLTGLLPEPAHAVIICQNRKGKVKLEAGPECRNGRKWFKVDDLDRVAIEAGLLCLDPTRLFLAPAPGRGVTDGCRQYDGDRTGCDLAYETRGGEATSCWYYAGRCLPCDSSVSGGAGIACVNTCVPSVCTEAGNRGFQVKCSNVTDETACNQAFAFNPGTFSFTDYAGVESCYWDAGGGSCKPCDVLDDVAGLCENQCYPTQCTSRTGGPRPCFSALDQLSCESRWNVAKDGTPTTCRWNGFTCGECTPEQEFRFGTCVNSCG